MNRLRRVLFLVVLVALSAFSYFFKDGLVTRAAERGLEAVFGAQADILNLHFQPLRGKISLAALAVTDADEADRNLFELGDTVIDLNLNQLLRGRFVLEEVVCRGLRFRTDRESPGKVAVRENGPAAGSLPPAGDKAAGGRLPSARELVEEHYRTLESPVRLRELEERLRSVSSAWEERRLSLEAEARAAATAAEEVLALRAEDLDSPEEAAGALQSLDRARRTLADGAAAFRRAGNDIARERQSIEESLAAVADSRSADRDRLLRLRGLSAAEEGGLPSRLLRRLLEPKLGRFSRYAVRAVEAAAALEKERPPRAQRRRRGRVLEFPRGRYPRFLLQSLEASLKEDGREVRAEIADLSSDMELWGRPARARVSLREAERELELTGTLDLRGGAGQTLALTLSTRDERTRIAPEGWPPLAGRYELAAALAVGRERSVAGDLRIQAEVQAAGENSGDPGGRILARSLAAPAEMVIQGTYTVSREGEIGLRVSSNLDELLGRAAAAELEELGRELERELATRLEAEAGENRRLYAALEEEWLRLQDGAAELAALDRALAEQSGSYSRRLQRLGGAALPEALKQLKLPGN